LEKKIIADMQSYQIKSGSMNTENRISKEINIRQPLQTDRAIKSGSMY